MGVVYAAVDEKLHRQVAVKMVRDGGVVLQVVVDGFSSDGALTNRGGQQVRAYDIADRLRLNRGAQKNRCKKRRGIRESHTDLPVQKEVTIHCLFWAAGSDFC